MGRGAPESEPESEPGGGGRRRRRRGCSRSPCMARLGGRIGWLIMLGCTWGCAALTRGRAQHMPAPGCGTRERGRAAALSTIGSRLPNCGHMPAGRLTHGQPLAAWGPCGGHVGRCSNCPAALLHRAVIAPEQLRECWAPLPRRPQFNPCACCPSAPLRQQSRERKFSRERSRAQLGSPRPCAPAAAPPAAASDGQAAAAGSGGGARCLQLGAPRPAGNRVPQLHPQPAGH